MCLGTEEDDSDHTLLTRNFIKVNADNLLLALQQEIPDLTLVNNSFILGLKILYPMTLLQRLFWSSWEYQELKKRDLTFCTDSGGI